MVITDEFLADLMKPLSVVQIHGKPYRVTEDKNFAVGDVVLDRTDGMYATIDGITGNKANLRDEEAVQLGVPLAQLVKLESK